MSLAPGTRLGALEVVAPLGAGGMGEVYRVRDTVLGREVALKVLPDAVAGDADRLARFEREARVLASLNHPHITQIHGVEAAGAVRGLVMELVEGDDLSQRLARGPLPLDDALAVARQLVDALAAAHDLGVVHRDLKPANVKVRSDGVVKVLDFGLAKALEPASVAGSASVGDPAQSPTITSPALTGRGVILGTAAYMAPEQVKGRAVDRRADIWAFGCVLYEMLTARRAFPGEDMAETLGAVVKTEPDWSMLPAGTPGSLRRLLQRCLTKDPSRRLQHIADARLELDDAERLDGEDVSVTRGDGLDSRGWAGRRLLMVATLVATVAMVAGSLVTWLTLRENEVSPAGVVRAMVPLPESWVEASAIPRGLAVSPNGRQIALGLPGNRLGVRDLDAMVWRTIGTFRGNVNAPRYSPDGRLIAFWEALLGLRVVDVASGAVTSLSPELGAPGGIGWLTNDALVFAVGQGTGGLSQVAASGGPIQPVTTLDTARGERRHRFPDVLPGGRAVIFTAITTRHDDSDGQIEAFDLVSKARRPLVTGVRARYVPPGYLVYESRGALMAVAFDPDRLALRGVPARLSDALPGWDVAANGTLFHLTGAFSPKRVPVWVDRAGRETPLPVPPRAYTAVRISPDGTQVALTARDDERDIWRFDLTRQIHSRVTLHPGDDLYGTWYPDGQRLLWASSSTDTFNIVMGMADGTGNPRPLTRGDTALLPTSVAPDGSVAILRAVRPDTGADVMLLSLDDGHRLTPLIATPFDERNGEISPDGRWLAYDSNESGTFEVYVRPFPSVDGGKWQVSSGGGNLPKWARSGKELFYRTDPDRAVMGVTFDAASGSPRFGPPARLVAGQYWDAGVRVAPSYDISSDGTRFLMLKQQAGDAADVPGVVIVQNWIEEVKKLVP